MRTGYVISRVDESAPSGVQYWTGTIACLADDEAGPLSYAGAAHSRHNVLIVDSAEEAEGLALWLNTCPVRSRVVGAGLWQATPIGAYPTPAPWAHSKPAGW